MLLAHGALIAHQHSQVLLGAASQQVNPSLVLVQVVSFCPCIFNLSITLAYTISHRMHTDLEVIVKIVIISFLLFSLSLENNQLC